MSEKKGRSFSGRPSLAIYDNTSVRNYYLYGVALNKALLKQPFKTQIYEFRLY